MPRIVGLVMAVALAAAQTGRSVDELVSFIKSAIKLKQDDKKVADEVQKIRLTNRLDDRAVEELQHLGAGPKTVAALHKLAEASAGLPGAAPSKAPSSEPAIPAPGAAELKQIVTEIRETALDYTRKLPNYICAQQTRRHVDPTGSGDWRLADTIVEQLSFFEQKESYKVILINDRPVAAGTQHNQLGGAKSAGEFGSILHGIFDPETGTEFQWERWTTLHGRRTWVLSFRVRQPGYGIHHEASKQSISVGYHGILFADCDTRTVRRVEMQCDDIPADFPIQSVALELDYDVFEIAGQKYVLPAHSSVRSREGKYLSWNEVSYHNYNKFTADVNITFDK